MTSEGTDLLAVGDWPLTEHVVSPPQMEPKGKWPGWPRDDLIPTPSCGVRPATSSLTTPPSTALHDHM